MIKWAYVVNGEILEALESLPRSWKNISNLFVFEDNETFLNTISWYKVDDQRPILNSNQHHEDVRYVFDGESKKVIITATIVDNLVDYLTERMILLTRIRERRDELLRNSDWTQLADIQATQPQLWKDMWLSYRQRLRDLPQQYMTIPIDQLVDFNQIDFYEGRP